MEKVLTEFALHGNHDDTKEPNKDTQWLDYQLAKDLAIEPFSKSEILAINSADGATNLKVKLLDENGEITVKISKSESILNLKRAILVQKP